MQSGHRAADLRFHRQRRLPLSQDIEGARRLLDDNGVVDTDGDGVREYNGAPLRLTYQTSVNAIRQDTQALVRDWWRQIGIEAVLTQHDASVFFGGDTVADKEASYRRFFADLQMYATGPDIDPQQFLSGPLCKHIQTVENDWSLGNNARSCNPEYDRLFARLEQTRIGPGRATLVKQLNDLYVQGYYEIPLVNRGAVSAHLNTLMGRPDQRLGQRVVEYRRLAALKAVRFWGRRLPLERRGLLLVPPGGGRQPVVAHRPRVLPPVVSRMGVQQYVGDPAALLGSPPPSRSSP